MVKPSSRPNPKQTIRLADVAQAAHVSIATASLALRDDPTITPTTRQKVQEAAQQLGYRTPVRKVVTPAARSRATDCRSILYCVVDHPLGKYEYSDFLEGVMKGCQERQIRLELQRPKTGDLLDPSAAREVDGVLLTGVLNPSWIEAFRMENPRLLVVGNYGFPEVSSVEVDLSIIGDRLAQRLLGDGHERLLHFPHDVGNYFARQLLYALRRSLSLHGIDLPAAQVDNGGDVEAALSRLLPLLRQPGPPFTAITSDSAAYLEHLLAGIQEAGLAVPVGYALANDRLIDGIALLDAGWTPCGRRAVERLIHLCAAPPEWPSTDFIPPGDWLGD